MNNYDISIVWFRQDLRLEDNPALVEASKHGKILPIYILDDINSEDYKLGAASRVWLHHSLKLLNKSLNNNLSIYTGNPIDVLLKICANYQIKRVFWNRCYEPWQINRDSKIKELFMAHGIEVNSYNGSLLWEPWLIKKDDGTPYKIFTPFYQNGCLNAIHPRKPLPTPTNLTFHQDKTYSQDIDSLNLLPAITWDIGISNSWQFGEKAASNILIKFLENGIINYKEGRDYPSESFTSRLSPYLHFGEISPNQIWYAIKQLGDNINTKHFCKELAWREFSYNLLYYNKNLPEHNLNKKFDLFPWQLNQEHFNSWKKGLTGVPIIDAGMRELWQTGYMHNRVRMIVASFLVKNLLIDWRYGARWFWDCLVDADLANNSASWQWVAGCGTDAAPYFRIFNPITQSEKFDPDGNYIRKYIPEISNLPNKYLFNPSAAPENILLDAGIKLGITYPKIIVDISKSRQSALAIFQSLPK